MLRRLLSSVFQSINDKNTSTPSIISKNYAQLNTELHIENPTYGSSGWQWASTVQDLIFQSKATSVLDYGCGKQTLAKSLPHINITGFDPAIPGLDNPPAPADLLVCTDVLEHVEPEFIDAVLDDLARLTKKIALVTVATRAAEKYLADGRNAHLTVEPLSWWRNRFTTRFNIIGIKEQPGFEFALILKNRHFNNPINTPNEFQNYQN